MRVVCEIRERGPRRVRFLQRRQILAEVSEDRAFGAGCAFAERSVLHVARLIMVFIVSHPCGFRVRFNAKDALRRLVCSRCKQPIRVSAWQKFCARLGDARSTNVRSPRLPTSVPSTTNADVVATLSRLARRAWAGRQLGHGSFLFTPSLLLIRDDAVLNEAAQALYSHARSWADGLDIPYHIPRISVSSCSHDTAGQFVVDDEGWTSIEISRDFLDTPRAVWLIMAHEVCHHILDHAG